MLKWKKQRTIKALAEFYWFYIKKECTSFLSLQPRQ